MIVHSPYTKPKPPKFDPAFAILLILVAIIGGLTGFGLGRI